MPLPALCALVALLLAAPARTPAGAQTAPRAQSRFSAAERTAMSRIAVATSAAERHSSSTSSSGSRRWSRRTTRSTSRRRMRSGESSATANPVGE